MALTDHPILRATITDLRVRLNALPRISIQQGGPMEQHRAHREATRQLGQHLTDTYGARVAERHDTNLIRMHGIASSASLRLSRMIPLHCLKSPRPEARSTNGANSGPIPPVNMTMPGPW